MIKINGKYGYVDFVNEKGENHRLNGPAFIDVNYQAWYKNGKRHNYGEFNFSGAVEVKVFVVVDDG